MINNKNYILIVDDNLKNLQITGKILKDEGYLISVAQDGQSALAQLEQFIPDLILLDIMMPVMDGHEFCRTIKKQEKFKDIPVIFLTAKNQTDDLAEGFRAGGIDYITKPFRREELLVRVENHIELASSRKRIIDMNSTRDKLYSIIAHDIRSPLNSIMQTVSAIADGYMTAGTQEFQEIIEFLDKITTETATMVDNLLTYTRAQGQSIEIVLKLTDLYPLLIDCVNLAGGAASRKNITITYNFPEEIVAFYDEQTIHAVLRNILSNAIKFTPENGRIEIYTRYDSYYAVISIKDSGIGMSGELRKKIFLQNEHFTSPGTNNERGSGLGSFIMKDFVKRNNGKMEVDSSPGNGTEVSVFLPLKD